MGAEGRDGYRIVRSSHMNHVFKRVASGNRVTSDRNMDVVPAYLRLKSGKLTEQDHATHHHLLLMSETFS